METGLIYKVVNRSKRTIIIWSVILLLVIGGALALNLRYFYNFVLGPFDADPDKVLQTASASDLLEYWVNLQGDEMINTGVQFVETSDGGKETIEASYFAMWLNDRLLLVQLPGDQQAESLPAQVSGWLTEISDDENAQIVQDIENEYPELKGMFLPFKLQSGNFRVNGIIGLVIGVILFGLGLFGIYRFVRYTTDPNGHPILKKLSRFGPVDFVINQIEMELCSPHTTVGKLHLTKSWLVNEAGTNLHATRYEDVAWVYQHVFTQKSYGITVAKTYSAMVYDRFGVLSNIVAGRKEEDVNQMLAAICERAPWAVVGFTNEIENVWKKNRQGFLAAVEQRKAEARLN